MTQFVTVTYKDDPTIQENFANHLLYDNWPAWFFDAQQPVDTKFPHGWYPGPVVLTGTFSEYSFVVFEASSNKMVATGHMVPVYSDIPIAELPDGGWDWGVSEAVRQEKMRQDGEDVPPPNMVVGLSINILPEWRKGHDLSEYCIKRMADIVKKHDIHNLVIPLRPNGKIKYQKMDIDEYFAMKGEDGKHVDYWLQKHLDSGIELIRPCRDSMTMVDTVAKWEGWLGEKLPTSGEYYFPDRKHTFLGPLVVDVEKDICTYVDPNVWGRYSL
jgi:hypothetical protein